MRFAVPTTDPKLALTVTPPTPAPVATPLLPAALLTVAMEGADELHNTRFVTSCMEPSVNVPWAVNGWLNPSATIALAGEMEIDCRAGGELVTVSDVDPTVELKVALTVLSPDAMAVADPVGLMLARFELDEVQTAVPVRSCWLLSLKMPVAANCCVLPTKRDALAGATLIAVNNAAVTVRVAELLKPPNVAVTVIWPGTKLVTSPFVLIAATEESERLHCAWALKSCVLLSLNVPVTANCWVVPAAIVGPLGFTVRAVKVAEVMVSKAEPLIDPTAAEMVV